MTRKDIIKAMSITKSKHHALSQAYMKHVETQICKMGNDGHGPVAIAKALNKPQQTVSDVLAKHKIKPAEERKRIFLEERPHLEARGTVMEIVAPPGETHRVARSDDSHLAAASRADAEPSSTSSAARPTSAKRPLRMAPTTEDARRLTPLRDELATQPPRKKLTELVAHMDVPEMRGDGARRF